MNSFNALQVSDWLQNMSDVFFKVAGEIFDKDKSSSEMLVYSTLINSTVSAYNILHGFPSVVSRIGPIYRELRAYYDCIWQITLLMGYTSKDDRARISKLVADVDFRIARDMKSLFFSLRTVREAINWQ